MADKQQLLDELKLYIDPIAQTLVCCHEECRFALSIKPSPLHDHLRQKHQVPIEKRQRLICILQNCQPALQQPADAPLRSDGCLSDVRLREFAGFSCRLCRFYTASDQIIRRHANKPHGRAEQRAGLRRIDTYRPVYLQAWTRNPVEGRYWIVEKNDSMV
jgi:hypothetical protein